MRAAQCEEPYAVAEQQAGADDVPGEQAKPKAPRQGSGRGSQLPAPLIASSCLVSEERWSSGAGGVGAAGAAAAAAGAGPVVGTPTTTVPGAMGSVSR